MRPWRGFRRAMAETAIGSGADLNTPWHRFRLLRDRDGQHAVLSGGVDFLTVHCIRQDEAPMEMAVSSLGTSTLQLFTAFRQNLLASIAGQSEYSSIERQFYFSRIDAWQVNIQFETICVLVDVDRRNPGSHRGTAVILARVAEQTIDFLLQARHHAPGILSHHRTHGTTPYRLCDLGFSLFQTPAGHLRQKLGIVAKISSADGAQKKPSNAP